MIVQVDENNRVIGRIELKMRRRKHYLIEAVNRALDGESYIIPERWVWWGYKEPGERRLGLFKVYEKDEKAAARIGNHTGYVCYYYSVGYTVEKIANGRW